MRRLTITTSLVSLAYLEVFLFGGVQSQHQLPSSCSVPLAFAVSEQICDAEYHGNVVSSATQQLVKTTENDAPAGMSWVNTGFCVRDYCLFSNPGFNAGRGISVISTSENVERIKDIVTKFNRESQINQPTQTLQFYMAEVPGKGLGIIANASMSRGTRVMEQLPALVVHRKFLEHVPQHEQQPLLDAAVESLPPVMRSMFLSQMGHFGGHKITDILATNSFQSDLGGEDGHHYSNYPEVSRFNHDCRPNVAFYINDKLAHTTTAVRDIEPGEELTITYLDSFEPRVARQERALQAWGFKCTCSQCSLPDKLAARSDRRLEEMARLQSQLQDFHNTGITPELIRRYIKLYKDEDLVFEIAGAYTLAALNYNMLGEETMAVKYAKLAVEAGRIEHGSSSSDVREMQALLQDPRKHLSWRRRLRTPRKN